MVRPLEGPGNLAAFANTRGGVLVVGVEVDGVTVLGYDPDDAELRVVLNEIVDGLHLTPDVRRVPTPGGLPVVTFTVRPAATEIRPHVWPPSPGLLQI